MTHKEINWLAYKIICDYIVTHNALADIRDFDGYIYEGEFYNSAADYCPENHICSEAELEAAIDAANEFYIDILYPPF